MQPQQKEAAKAFAYAHLRSREGSATATVVAARRGPSCESSDEKRREAVPWLLAGRASNRGRQSAPHGAQRRVRRRRMPSGHHRVCTAWDGRAHYVAMRCLSWSFGLSRLRQNASILLLLRLAFSILTSSSSHARISSVLSFARPRRSHSLS